MKKIKFGLKKLSVFTILAAAVLSIQKCKKSDTTPDNSTSGNNSNTNPPPTNNNYFGPMTAEVNGKAWTATWLSGGTITNYTAASYSASKLEVVGWHYNYNSTNAFTDWDYIWFSIPNVSGTGTYKLGDIKNEGAGYYWVGNTTDINTYTWYSTNATYTGTVTISKLDVTAKKVSGTFSFKAQKTTTGTDWDSLTVNITKGAFTDVRF